MAGFFALATGEWLLARAHPALGEAIYFLDRLQHLNSGQLPYRDFELPYGPLFLYFPWALARTLHLSIPDSYYPAWIAETLLGVLLIYLCITLLPGRSSRTKNVLFLLVIASWWASPITFGSNYTAFRFFLAPVFCLLSARLIAASLHVILQAFLLVAAVSLLLLVSPEQAIAFTGALLLFLLLRYAQLRDLHAFWLALLVAAGAVPCFLLASRFGELDSLRVMSAGGYNFPLIPVPSQIPIFGLLIVAACVLGNSLRLRQPLGSVELLVLLGLFSLPAIFGRADPGHLIINATPALLAAWISLAEYPSLFRPAVWLFTILATLLPTPLVLFLAVRAQHSNRAPIVAPSGTNTPDSAHLTSGAAADEPFAPFGRPIANSSQISLPLADTGFYNGLELVATSQQVEQKVQELRDAPVRPLLLPDHFTCAFGLDRTRLQKSLLTPFVPFTRRIATLHEPLCAYINLHYRQSAQPTGLPHFSFWLPLLSSPAHADAKSSP